MKLLFLSSMMLLPWSLAEEVVFEDTGLQADEFEARESAAEQLLQWVREGDEEEKKINGLVQKYFAAVEPEEQFRLAEVLFELKKDKVPQEGSGFIGISMEHGLMGQPEVEVGGALVTLIIEGTPAEKVGLEVGDLITKIDKESIVGENPVAHLISIIKGKAPGTVIEVTLERAEEELKFEFPLMNAGASVDPRRFGGEARIDRKKADQLLRKDFRRWLLDQRNDDITEKP